MPQVAFNSENTVIKEPVKEPAQQELSVGEGLKTEMIHGIPIKTKYRSLQKSLNYYKNRCLKLKLENEILKKKHFWILMLM